MKNWLLVVAFVFSVGGMGSASATPGKLNASGCHNSKTAGYHCHPERVPNLAGGESQTQRNKRLARECKGRANAGACLGFAH